jgi:C4-dicarboxylate transporter DctQ subunit
VKLSAVDDVVFKVERAVIVFAVGGMTLLVGADVVQRTFSRPVGKTEQLVAWIGEKLAGPLSESTRELLEGRVGNAIFGVLALALLTLAAHASRQVKAERTNAPAPRLTGSLALGVAALLVASAAVKALLWAFPSSVPGAQKLALGLMLWAGMLGASLATREKRHIVVDTLKKKVPQERERLFALVSGVVTSVFCAFVALLGALQLASEIGAWAGGEGVGMYESVPLPTWIATLAIPAAFSIMALRFLAYAVRDFRFGPQRGGDGGHGVDLDKLADEAPPS